jgi:UDP-N-acetylglucosamine--N-acetylmuramyl-(pentapeptide) pyrophosphoryl-undecaprenol N-acetylglucosamine transferase
MILKIPLYLHEQNFYPGIANRLISKIARKIFLSYAEAKKYFPASKTVFTGNFVRFKREEAKNLPFSYPVKILVLGGSLGARFLNDIILKFQEKYSSEKYLFTLISGKRYYEEYREKCKNYSNLEVIDYGEDMLSLYRGHHLVVCRGGATTLWELLVLKKPSLIIPWANAAENHQLENARFLKQIEGGEIILEKDFSAESLYDFLNQFDEKRYLQMISNLDKIKVAVDWELIFKELEIEE